MADETATAGAPDLTFGVPAPDYSLTDTLPSERGADPDSLAERYRLNQVNSFYRGTLAGAGRLAAMAGIMTKPEDELSDADKVFRKQWSTEYPQIVADLDKYDKLQPWGTTAEGLTALGGSLTGGLLSPESWLGAPAKGATWLIRTGKAAIQQGLIQGTVDPIVQWLNQRAGVQQDFDPVRWGMSFGLGAIIGGGLHAGGELVTAAWVRFMRADLAKQDPAFLGQMEALHQAWAEQRDALVGEAKDYLKTSNPGGWQSHEIDQFSDEAAIQEAIAHGWSLTDAAKNFSIKKMDEFVAKLPDDQKLKFEQIAQALDTHATAGAITADYAAQVKHALIDTIDGIHRDVAAGKLTDVQGQQEIAQTLHDVQTATAATQSGGQNGGTSWPSSVAPPAPPPSPYAHLPADVQDRIADVQTQVNDGLITEAEGREKIADLTGKANTTSAPAGAVPAIEDASSWTKTGPQGGSNPGGKYKDPGGVEWYVKTPKTDEHVRNEMLANRLYAMTGADVPDLKFVMLHGKLSVASKMLPADLKQLGQMKSGSQAEQNAILSAQRHFATDAWLANHDVVGLKRDNLLVQPKGLNNAVRIDQGGALRFRAQGEPKTNFGPKVGEFSSMRDPKIAKEAGPVFGAMDDQALINSINRVLLVDEADIRGAVKKFGPLDPAENQKLADTLIARQQDLAAIRKDLQGKVAAKMSAAPPPPTGATTTATNPHAVVWGKDTGGTPLSPTHAGTPIRPDVTGPHGSKGPAGVGHLPGGPALKSAKAPKNWNKAPGIDTALAKAEPVLNVPPGKKAASGVIIREPDGRIWIIRPAGKFGGYEHTFPKGKQDAGLSLQGNALKEAFEETGLQAKITGLVGDFAGDTSMTRYYWGERTGGHPKDAHWESEAVLLVPGENLLDYLNKPRDHEVLAKVQWGKTLWPGKYGALDALGNIGPSPAGATSGAASATPAKITTPTIVTKNEAMTLKPGMKAYDFPYYVMTPEGGFAGYVSLVEAQAASGAVPSAAAASSSVGTAAKDFLKQNSAKHAFTTQQIDSLSEDLAVQRAKHFGWKAPEGWKPPVPGVGAAKAYIQANNPHQWSSAYIGHMDETTALRTAIMLGWKPPAGVNVPAAGPEASLEAGARHYLEINLGNVFTRAQIDAMSAAEAIDKAHLFGWQEAKSGSIPTAAGSHPVLPMDQASRYARAQAMGFDTSQIWYHGASKKFGALDLAKWKDEPAIFLSPKKGVAGSFGMTAYPMFLRAKKVLVVEPKAGHDSQGYSSIYFKQKIKEAKAGGYDAVLFKSVNDSGGTADQMALLHTNLARSIHAAFDPAEIDKPHLAAVMGKKPELQAVMGKTEQTPEEFEQDYHGLIDQAANDTAEAKERGAAAPPSGEEARAARAREAGAVGAAPEGATIAGSGMHGPVIEGLHGRWSEALAWMRGASAGDARGVLTIPGRDQRVDIIFGGTKHGLAHIDQKHPGDADLLPQLWPELRIVRESGKFIELESDRAGAVVAKDYKGEPKHWLLTFFRKGEREESARPAEETIRSPGDSGTAAQSPLRSRQEDIGASGPGGNPPGKPDLLAVAKRKSGATLAGEQQRPAAGVPGTAVATTGTGGTPATAGGAGGGGAGTGAAAAGSSPARQAAIQSLQQQVLALAKALGFTLHEGRVTIKGALAQFNTKTGAGQVKEIPDLAAVAHEAGHFLEAKVGQDLTNLINAHAAELGPLDYEWPAQARPFEGFAEFVRYLIGNVGDPAGDAQAKAPGFYAAFRTLMEQKAPAALKALDDAGNAFHAYQQASSRDVVSSAVRFSDEGEGWRKVDEKIITQALPRVVKTYLQNAYVALLDDKAPVARAVRDLAKAIRDQDPNHALVALKAAENPEVLLRMAARSQQGAVLQMQDGIIPYHGVVPEGPSLAAAITRAVGGPAFGWGTWDRELVKEFSRYLVARRAEVLWRRHLAGHLPNPPVAYSHGDAVQAIADFEAAHPTFREASGMVHDYTRQLLRKQFEGGLIDRDLHDRLLRDEFYVPMMRDMHDKPLAGEPSAGSGGPGAFEGPGMTSTIKTIRGSSRDVIDPLEAIMMQTFLVERTLRHNDIIRSFVTLARRAGIEGGKYVDTVPAHEARKYTFDLQDAFRRKAIEHGMTPDDAAAMAAAVADQFGEDPLMGSYFRMEPASKRGEPLVFYKEGGQLKVARFMSEKEGGHALYETLTAMPEPITDLWHDVIRGAAVVKRTGIVSNPTFALANYIRDQVTAGILRGDYIPFISGIKGLMAEHGGPLRIGGIPVLPFGGEQGEAAKLYAYAGGVAGGAATGPVERAAEADVAALSQRGYLVHRLTSFKGLLELSSVTEAGTRNSIFDTVYKAKKQQGLSDYEAMIEAAYQAQDILDFSRHGSRTLAIRNILPFINAHMQGLEKAWRTIVDPIARKIAGRQVLESDAKEFTNALLSVGKLGALGALGVGWAALNWESEAYRDANPYFKGTHLIVPFGDRLIVVPKPFELGTTFTAGEYAYARFMQDDPRAARQFAEATWQALAPPNLLTDIPLISTATELYLGKSLFTGNDIVPGGLQGLPAVQQYNDRTSSLAKALGAIIGVSPIKVDYAIGSEFGTWGRDIMAMSAGVDPDSPTANWDDRIFFRRFIKDPTRTSDITTRFWDYMGRTTGTYSQDVAGYNALVAKGPPHEAEARAFLDGLPNRERAFVILKTAANDLGGAAFNADARRLHPLTRAYDAVELLNHIRRDLTDNNLTSWADKMPIKLNPDQRRDLIDNIRELAQMEMRNALVIIREPGYDRRPLLDPQATFDKIAHISPQAADEIATRYATAKILTTKAVADAYPQMERDLLQHGSQAAMEVFGLAMGARADGYEFGGLRTRRPPAPRVVIPGAAGVGAMP